eukprot:NODE_3933_length_1139_cov_96.390748_g3742_i0.p1 GENE.NODE_3933_length_1139_cov_96.390748_g3742_i0~~NODE_3933_length_1139_cov_96.390748_g3742_i0.p1  ORF type:complete len:254 (+),score=21.24 NODE_3933_length_1139_cov_96.390748_g3742_i0:242-1003(+)
MANNLKSRYRYMGPVLKWDGMFEYRMLIESGLIFGSSGDALDKVGKDCLAQAASFVGDQVIEKCTDLRDPCGAFKGLRMSELLLNPDGFITFIQSVHRLLISESSLRPGEWRDACVKVDNSSWCPPQHHELPALLEVCVKALGSQLPIRMRDDESGLPVDPASALGFAFDVHIVLTFLHPFADGNGRIARLVMNLLLLEFGFLPIILTPKHRIFYVTSLDAAFWGQKEGFCAVMLDWLQHIFDAYHSVLKQWT